MLVTGGHYTCICGLQYTAMARVPCCYSSHCSPSGNNVSPGRTYRVNYGRPFDQAHTSDKGRAILVSLKTLSCFLIPFACEMSCCLLTGTFYPHTHPLTHSLTHSRICSSNCLYRIFRFAEICPQLFWVRHTYTQQREREKERDIYIYTDRQVNKQIRLQNRVHSCWSTLSVPFGDKRSEV